MGIYGHREYDPREVRGMIRRYPARPESLASIRAFVRERARMATFGQSADELALAVNEAAANAIRHANTASIELHWIQADDHIEVEVRDEGRFQERVPMPEFGTGGLGLHLMAAFVDELALKEGTSTSPGTTVRLTKRKA
jgi:anti-sigma regulatory factor (Ser/Thr protein kinase)